MAGHNFTIKSHKFVIDTLIRAELNRMMCFYCNIIGSVISSIFQNDTFIQSKFDFIEPNFTLK